MSFPSSPRAQLDGLFKERPVNDEALGAAEEAHRNAVHHELRAVEARLLLHLARGTFSADMIVPSPAGPTRRHPFDLLAAHPRLLVIGGRASGKTALANLLAAQAVWRDLGFGRVVPIVVDAGQLEQPHLDEAEIARQNPALGAQGVGAVMEAGRGLLIVDGLDEAEAPDTLKASLIALSRTYPSSRFMVTSRPLPPKIAGTSETALDGFLTVRMAAPEAAPVTSIEELDDHRFPARWAERVADDVQVLLDAWAPERLPRGSMLGRFTGRGRQILASHLAVQLHDSRTLECIRADLERCVREELAGARWFADTEQLLMEDEQPGGGEPVADPQAVAKEVVATARRHPGVLVETRPGVFGFASLAVQQFLTALFFTSERNVSYLV